MGKYSPINGIIFESEEDAKTIINDLNKTMETYGTVSVADLYDLSGLICNYKDNGYGWTDISSAKIVADKRGYILQIDEPVKFK